MSRWPLFVMAGLLFALLFVALLLWAITRRRPRVTPPDRDPATKRELVATTGQAGA